MSGGVGNWEWGVGPWPDVWGDGPDGFVARVALTVVVMVLLIIGHP
jgi:uncharacterized membrane protein